MRELVAAFCLFDRATLGHHVLPWNQAHQFNDSRARSAGGHDPPKNRTSNTTQMIARTARPWHVAIGVILSALLCNLVFFPSRSAAGNFSVGITAATVPWSGGVVPYEFTNTLSAAQKKAYLD